MVRCKFWLREITDIAGFSTKKFVFSPQYDTSIPEDQRFAKDSPSGEFVIWVSNLAAQEQFKLGGYYYFDVTPVPVPLQPA